MSEDQRTARPACAMSHLSDEAREGRDAFLEKRPPDFGLFPSLP